MKKKKWVVEAKTKGYSETYLFNEDFNVWVQEEDSDFTFDNWQDMMEHITRYHNVKITIEEKWVGKL